MTSAGKVRVVVRSRKIPTSIIDLSEPIYSTSGILMGTRKNTVVLYDYVLDDDHRRAIQEGQRLSCNLGLELEVVDVSKGGIFRRVLSSFGFRGSRGPTLEVAPLPTKYEGSMPVNIGR